MFRFLSLSISIHPSYSRVLPLLKDPSCHRTLLDLGCCFAQDIRKLIYDGVPSDRLYGSDIQADFFDLGYGLFRDKDTCKAHFYAAYVFQDIGWDKIAGNIDFIYAGSFFHIFSWDDQVRICQRVIEILKPQKGSTIFGRQTGNLKGQEATNAASGKTGVSRVWRHDPESFEKLWDVAGQATGTKWKTWAELDIGECMGPGHFSEAGPRRLRFEVERLE